MAKKLIIPLIALITLLAPALAHTGDDLYGHHMDMMGYWGTGISWFMWVLWLLFIVLVITALILLIMWLVRQLQKPVHSTRKKRK